MELQPRLALPRLVHAVGVRDLVCMRRALATKDVASARPLSMSSWLSQAVAVDSIVAVAAQAVAVATQAVALGFVSRRSGGWTCLQ